jgi:hypothetical protein
MLARVLCGLHLILELARLQDRSPDARATGDLLLLVRNAVAHVSPWPARPGLMVCAATRSRALRASSSQTGSRSYAVTGPIFGRFSHVSYATRPMRGAALVCYCISSARTTLAAVACLATPAAGSTW